MYSTKSTKLTINQTLIYSKSSEESGYRGNISQDNKAFFIIPRYGTNLSAHGWIQK